MIDKENQERIVRFAKQDGIKDTITCQTCSYPSGFYLVLEHLDVVMRVRSDEQMGTSGVDELATLLAIMHFDRSLLSHCPNEAYAFLKCLVHPQKDWEICQDANMGFGYLHGAYYALRQYLIDNKERIMEAYTKYYELSSAWSDEQDEKWKKQLNGDK